MQTGIVKWFNNTKGYGFILSENGGGDIFAHYSAIDMDGYKTLKAGQTVQFETEQGPKGLHAKHIQAGPESPKVQTNHPQAVLPSTSETQLSEA
jgi:CspA family cold shock protein